MIWMLAAIITTTIGVMAVIDAYFEGDIDSYRSILESYEKEIHTVDYVIWCNSFVLYEKARGRPIRYDDSCNA